MKWHYKSVLFIFVVICCGLFVGVWKENKNPTHTSQALIAGTAFNVAKPLPEFQLMGTDGVTFTNKRFKNHWSFVFFGYSQCPQLCPATLGYMNQLAEILGPTHARFAFITINPEADTPEALKKYLAQTQFAQANFIGATGNREEIQKLAQTIGIHIAENNIPINGHIEHSGSILLINPEGKLSAIFSAPRNALAIAKDFKTLMHRYHATA